MTTAASIVFCLAAVGSVEAIKVTVLGGTGFVGSRVCKVLVSKGAEVTSVSRSGSCPAWASDEPWTKEVKWVAADLLGADAAVGLIAGDCDSVVSCVGVVDLDPQLLRRGNGAANVNAFASLTLALTLMLPLPLTLTPTLSLTLTLTLTLTRSTHSPPPSARASAGRCSSPSPRR